MDSSDSSSLSRMRGIYRKKHSMRAAFRSISLLVLIAGYAAYNYVMTGTSADTRTTEARQLRQREPVTDIFDERQSSRLLTRISQANVFMSSANDELNSPTTTRAQQASEGLDTTNDDLNDCEELDKADPEWVIVLYVIGILYMFLALAIVCDEFFVPALEEMSSEKHLNLSMDVAGATLMAAGGSAPELFTSLFGTFTESEVGFGTIVGSAVFNVLFVIGMCSLLSKEVLTLTWWPLFRDSLYYAIGLVVLAVFTGVNSSEQIEFYEAAILFSLYLGYVIVMAFNRQIFNLLTGKILDSEGGIIEEGSPSGAETNGTSVERAIRDGPTSTRSFESNCSTVGSVIHPRSFRWPGTFRAGVLKLLRDPDSWVETAGVGIVAKIAGNVDHIFREVDENGDGCIDQRELTNLFEKLDCHLTSDEMRDVFKQLDQDKDGRISENEFTEWYVRSKERIKSRVKTTFDYFDANKSGSIEREEVKMLLETLEPRVTDDDVEEALQAMYQDGPRDEISFREFSDWYLKSIIYERQKKQVEQELQGVWENVCPPSDAGFIDLAKYILVLPLVLLLTLTVPDSRRPGLSKWCYLSFLISIAWIGGFSYLMVAWTEVVGNTLGIPAVLMGLTFLAAGTSVPDLLSSVIVARRGEGDMAVSSSIGSNIFDILVGLPIPWMAYTAYPEKPDIVNIGSSGVW
eukprot:CAMPEP_0118673494 /NCGR_PEP_ID=MMETSP0800-20121206/353_1 /TAXON_ID=210618 ORGANISM="Striatella unipunctata, Strain CCMP2910" /NCGR_SAMPLE_ID=MMETSP0800 /ASSEMBLY_ACC=CAM_ASM_000638 /LENGTH=687 /DNA_ID=CAMNT_0006568563 /DNA_START=50 /DNA_END=2110 /DNA_ORIENTATION=-